MQCRIDLVDVVNAGSVAMAIIAWANGSENTAASSGASAAFSAFDDGAMVYIDTDDGRACHLDIGDWTDDSVVCIDVPTIDEALQHPDLARSMWTSVRSYHYSCSDISGWKELIDELKEIEGAVQTLRGYGPMITGDNIADTAHAWLDAGIKDDGSIDLWCDIGCWDPATAAKWVDAGLSPQDVETAAHHISEAMPDDKMRSQYHGGIVYACCNNDIDYMDVINMHNMLLEND